MKIETIYIDDDTNELEKYKYKFSKNQRIKDKFNVQGIEPPKHSSEYDQISEFNPALFLVDFNLDRPNAKKEVIGFSGVGLATELRSRYPEVPIILFTRKSLFNIRDYSKVKETLSSIDEIMYKPDLFRADTLLIDEIYNLAVGYYELRKQKSRSFLDLVKLLKTPSIDREKMELASPPSMLATGWSVSEVARWIRNTLLKYPGILYDSLHAATFLGISNGAFLADNVQEFFIQAKYNGIFMPDEGRWWKSGLLQAATKISRSKEKGLPVRKGFPAAWFRFYRESLEPSMCVSSGESPAEWVCYILHQPTMIKYSLAYRPDKRPEVMDEARVSFRAIQTSNEFEPKLLDPMGRQLVTEIRKMILS